MSRNDGLKQWVIMNRAGVILQSNGIGEEDGRRISAVVSRLADKMDQFSQKFLTVLASVCVPPHVLAISSPPTHRPCRYQHQNSQF